MAPNRIILRYRFGNCVR